MRKLSLLYTAIAISLALPNIANAAPVNSLMAGGEVAGIPTRTSGLGSNTGSSGSIFNGVSSSQDSCETISTSIGEAMSERMKAVLPQNEGDNVTTAVDESMAVSVTNQPTSSLSISELFSNPFDYVKKAATKLYDTAIEKAKEFLQNAYAAAVRNVTSYVNNMYAKQLSKISSKLGDVGGPLLRNTMGQFVPNITSHLSTCASTMSIECMQQVTDKIGQSASEAANRAMRNVGSAVEDQTNRVINRTTNEVNERTNSIFR